MKRIPLFALLFVGLVAIGLTGCGGGGGGAGSNNAGSQSSGNGGGAQSGGPQSGGSQSGNAQTGALRFTVKWPAHTRLIPSGAYSIQIAVTPVGQQTVKQLVVRPNGTDTTVNTFASLPAGVAVVTATAYPNLNGTGTAQASGSEAVTILVDKTLDTALALNSTINTVSVTPTSPIAGVGDSVSLVGTAYDAQGSMVLSGGANWTWSNDNTSVATLSASGAIATVTSRAAGRATLSVLEGESGKSGQAVLTVNVVSVTVSPDPVTLVTGASQQFTANVTGLPNPTVTWSVQEGTAGGTITPTGLYTAPATAGSYHVQASIGSHIGAAAITVNTSSGGGGGGLASSAWSKYRSDPQNTGYGGGSGATGQVKWIYTPSIPTAIPYSIGTDGSVYITSDGTYALNPASGASKWHATQTITRCGLTADGTLYGSQFSDGTVYALDSTTGNKIASVSSGTMAGLGADGTLYIESFDNATNKTTLAATNGKTGAKAWIFAVAGRGASDVAIGKDGTVYFALLDSSGGGADTPRLYALNGKNGTKLWSYDAPTEIATPAVGPNGAVYFTAGTVTYALEGISGTLKWKVNTNIQGNDADRQMLAIGKDGTVYVPAYVNATHTAVLALDGESGHQYWSFSLLGSVLGPSIGSDGMVYAVSHDDAAISGSGYIYAIDGATGSQQWTLRPGTGAVTSAIIGADGTIYVGTSTAVYAIK